MDKTIILNRYKSSDKQTLGQLILMQCNELLFNCYTLELPWLENQFQISCIPAGLYNVKKRYSVKYKNHFHVQDVPERSFILIHAGNYYTQTKGCILVGSSLTDINGDGYKDVINSKSTIKKLLEILPDEFRITIQ